MYPNDLRSIYYVSVIPLECSVATVNLGSNVIEGTTPQIGDSQVYSLTCTATVTCNMASNITMDGITLNITNGLGNVVMSSSNMVNDFVNDVFNVTLPFGSPVQLSDAGLYTCTVSINEMLSDMNDTFPFNVTSESFVIVIDVQLSNQDEFM